MPDTTGHDLGEAMLHRIEVCAASCRELSIVITRRTGRHSMIDTIAATITEGIRRLWERVRDRFFPRPAPVRVRP